MILWFQNLGEWVGPLMSFFTELGYPLPYVVLITLLYWSVDSRLGQRFAVFVLLSASINEIFKRIFHAPRPYWVDPRIRPIGHASTGFGMPSGHAQQSTAWIVVGDYLKKRWFWPIAFGLPLMIGLSRIYLGVHFPMQVVVGWIIGTALVAGLLRLERPIIRWMHTKSLVRQLLFVGCVTMLLLLIGGVSVKLLAHWQLPEEWIDHASVYLKAGKTLNPVDPEDVVVFTAGFLGITSGAILMTHFGGHNAGGPLWKRVMRYLVGLICVGGIGGTFITLSNMFAFEQEQILLTYNWQFVWVFLFCFAIIFLIPLLFRRLGLTEPAE